MKSTENGNGVTFRSGADGTTNISVSGFGPESAIDRAMQMVRVFLQGSVLIFVLFYKRYMQ